MPQLATREPTAIVKAGPTPGLPAVRSRDLPAPRSAALPLRTVREVVVLASPALDHARPLHAPRTGAFVALAIAGAAIGAGALALLVALASLTAVALGAIVSLLPVALVALLLAGCGVAYGSAHGSGCRCPTCGR